MKLCKTCLHHVPAPPMEIYDGGLCLIDSKTDGYYAGKEQLHYGCRKWESIDQGIKELEEKLETLKKLKEKP